MDDDRDVVGRGLLLQAAVSEALGHYGLVADAGAIARRPPPAGSFEQQLERVALSAAVVARVRRRIHLTPGERALVERLCDSALARRDRPRRKRDNRPASGAEVVAYVTAGGGAVGTFDQFRRRYLYEADAARGATAAPELSIARPRRRMPAPAPAAPTPKPRARFTIRRRGGEVPHDAR